MVHFNTSRRVGSTLLLVSSLLHSGCSTWHDDGEYACQGMPQGVRCLSARQVYALTTQAHTSTHTTTHTKTAPESINTNKQSTHSPQATISANHSALTLSTYSAPIRQSAAVLRIWIAPWENQSGDFMLGSYRYTDITPRRWQFQH